MSEAEELLREAREAMDDKMLSMFRRIALIAKIDDYLSRPADGVVVPREPTREMIKAGAEVDLINDGDLNAIAVNTWHAMLAAAPSDRKGGWGMREIPCTHEWYQGTCAHCEATPKQANRIAALEAEIKSDNKTIELLKTEIEALRKDAGRYRWLRQSTDWIRVTTANGFQFESAEELDADIDAAIDAAMKECK